MYCSALPNSMKFRLIGLRITAGPDGKPGSGPPKVTNVFLDQIAASPHSSS